MKKKLLMLITLVLLTLPIINVEAATRVNVYVFYGDGCSFCHKLLNYLEELEDDNNYKYMFETKKYEVWNNQANKTLMRQIEDHFRVNRGAVPFYVIGDEYFYGFDSEESPEVIKTKIKYMYENNALDVVSQYLNTKTTTTTTSKYVTTYKNNTTSSKYVTTSKNFTTTKNNSLTKGTTTTTTVPVTEEITLPITTTKKYVEAVPDKNGDHPEDVIKKYIDLLNKQDESAKDYMDPDAIKELENEDIDLFNKLFTDTKMSYAINDVLYYESGTYDGETITVPTYIYKVTMTGKMAGYNILEEEEGGEIWVTYKDNQYYIYAVNYGLELTPEQVFDLIGIFGELFKEEFGAWGLLFIPIIILMLLATVMPFIIFVVIFISIIKAVSKAKRNKDIIDQGGNPYNNGQGM